MSVTVEAYNYVVARNEKLESQIARDKETFLKMDKIVSSLKEILESCSEADKATELYKKLRGQVK
jgi:hypothetical protein